MRVLVGNAMLARSVTPGLQLPLAGLMMAVMAGCEGGGNAATTPATPDVRAGHYEQIVVKDPQQSAAFLAVEDLDGDGVREIVLSTLLELTPPGPPTALSRGALRIFKAGQAVDGPWDERVVVSTTDLDGYAFINTPQVFDVDGDGHKDLLVQTGFLSTLGGAQFWIKGPEFTERRQFAPETTRWRSGYFWHEAAQADLDGDGKLDIITTSAQTQDLLANPGNPFGSPDGTEKLKVEWHRNLGGGEFEYHLIETGVGGVFIKAHDVDGDGDHDLLLTQFFRWPELPSVLWLEQQEAPAPGNNYQGVWQRHTIDNTIGLGYHMELADLNGDGRIDLIVDSHHSQDNTRVVDAEGQPIPPGIYWFEFPDNPRQSEQWTRHVISQNFAVTLGGSPASQGVPGIFSVGDIDGDGRLDLAVPGDGNDKLYALRQRADGSFHEDVIEDGEKMIAMAVVADIDGDGRNEIVAAKHNSNDGGYSLPPGFLKIYRYVAD